MTGVAVFDRSWSTVFFSISVLNSRIFTPADASGSFSLCASFSRSADFTSIFEMTAVFLFSAVYDASHAGRTCRCDSSRPLINRAFYYRKIVSLLKVRKFFLFEMSFFTRFKCLYLACWFIKLSLVTLRNALTLHLASR